MKKCFKCHQIKPLNEFYRHQKMADGHLGKCKECTKSDTSKVYARKMLDPILHEMELDRSKRKYLKSKAEGKATNQSAAAKAKWRKDNPHKHKAQWMLRDAVRRGEIHKLPCEQCGEIKSQAHHDNYDKPYEVRWLCPRHHSDHHANVRRAKRLGEEPSAPVNQ